MKHVIKHLVPVLLCLDNTSTTKKKFAIEMGNISEDILKQRR